MNKRVLSKVAAVIILLIIIWAISFSSLHIWKNDRDFDHVSQNEERFIADVTSRPKCSLSRVCPPDHFAFSIRSGAANAVGPSICFEGQTIMSHLLNNVGPGLNIVVLNGESGHVEDCIHLTINGPPAAILIYLERIKPGRIILVASFDDVARLMSNEIRELFAGMGSSSIKNVNLRDSWVFAGRAGTGMASKSFFEKHAVSNSTNNIYEQWPEWVQVSGCFPKTQTGNGIP